MSVDELGLLHNRYIELSNRFRAAWTYQQFLAGLDKMLPDHGFEVNADEFQAVHNSLRAVSLALNASEIEVVARQLTVLEGKIDHIVDQLRQRDESVSPSTLRQFFQRVRNCDVKILQQMAKFFAYTQDGDRWDQDRLDKVDFLLTKASEQPDSRTGVLVLDRGRMMAVAQSLWHLLGEPVVPADEIRDRCELIQSILQEVTGVESFEEMDETSLVQRYRQLKASLGSGFFEPATLMSLLETNLGLKNRVRDLYRREEAQIVAEYQQIFDLHRDTPVDTELEGDLARFQEDIERFEQKLQKDEIRLEELARIRTEARRLRPKLSTSDDLLDEGPESAAGVGGAGGGGRELGEQDDSEAASAQLPAVRAVYDELMQALDDTDSQASTRGVTLSPELFAFRLEAREVLAYRRLLSPTHSDRDLERFILTAAALRVLISKEASEINGILDDTAVSGEAPVFLRARSTCRWADLQLRRFDHFISMAILDRQAEDSADLQLLRMRLLREFAGLWLLANKSF